MREQVRQVASEIHFSKFMLFTLAAAVAAGWGVTQIATGLPGLALALTVGVTVFMFGFWLVADILERRVPNAKRFDNDALGQQSASPAKLAFVIWCFLIFGVVAAIVLGGWAYLSLGTWFAQDAGLSIGITWLLVAGAMMLAIVDNESLTSSLFQRVIHWLAWPKASKLWLCLHIIVVAYLLADWIDVVWGSSAGKGARIVVVLGVSLYNILQRRNNNAQN